ncbi:MAG: type II toxin-antitoxin system prevent-host-death family antitoxin [Deltaproteobacteria bacterium]|nr:type II toxin-antitoxin system prevent-host-death family antitoxin [Deltaproteobacteria bacterium]MCB9786687.1 type II toxin-antitoxin system prevent-host-death family antitoxin [Deltaproteobacteria bacterium]
MDIGVRELKQRLSEMLDRAAAGEIIRVTDRGRPKAILSPIPGTARLAEGIAGGWIQAPEVEDAPRRVPRAASRRTSAQALAEDRSELWSMLYVRLGLAVVGV